MSPDQFLQRIQKSPPAPVYLFLGPEVYQLSACRRALVDKVLAPEDRENGLSRHDLEETTLAAVLDDARSLSLFAPNRVVWVSGAESALPRGRAVSDDENAAAADLAAYLKHPNSRHACWCSKPAATTSKAKTAPKSSASRNSMPPFPMSSSCGHIRSNRRAVWRRISPRKPACEIGLSEIGLLVESLAADAGRIANEIEKLRLYTGGTRKVTADDILRLVPNAQASTIFALVGALGRGDRKRSLDSLDTLLREGEYLPLALTFLATQFRLAMVARESGLKTSQQIQAHFTKQGIRIWRDRAEQVQQTVSAFPDEKLARAIEKVFWADKALRDTRPDDRVVMEELVLSLTN